MKIKVLDVRLCRAGGNHVQFDLLVNDTANRTYSATVDEINAMINDSPDRLIGIILMHGHYTKAGATTLAQKKAALLNQEFEW